MAEPSLYLCEIDTATFPLTRAKMLLEIAGDIAAEKAYPQLLALIESAQLALSEVSEVLRRAPMYHPEEHREGGAHG